MRKLHMWTIFFALLVLVTACIPSPIKAAPTLATDKPLYTQRDNQVTLMGSGYALSQIYYVWVKGPSENRTSYSGINFTAVSGGLIPPAVSLPINATSALGTHLVSVSTSQATDDSQARTHYGLWGTLKPLYQRTESITIFGGGLFPGTSFKLTVRNPAGSFVHEATIVSDALGDFNHTWRVPEDAVTDAYTIFIDGTGTFDNAQQDYVSVSKFSVTPAGLSVNVVEQPSSSYQRTDNAKISLAVKYPDGSPVLKSKADMRPVILLQNQSTVTFASISLIDEANGVWESETKIPANATPSARYRFELPADSFDDGFGNKGGPADVFSDYFQVSNATLLISSEVNGTQIQVPFGQVSIISKITYPDGSVFSNGTARVSVSAGGSTSDLRLAYDSKIRAWRASYASTFFDLWRVGTWTLDVEASDIFGNSGKETYEVNAQPYLFLLLVALVVALVLFGRWTVSRFGRLTYLRIRKTVQRFRR